jgi:hypothetical protein
MSPHTSAFFNCSVTALGSIAGLPLHTLHVVVVVRDSCSNASAHSPRAALDSVGGVGADGGPCGEATARACGTG